jgi:hypothetical protein
MSPIVGIGVAETPGHLDDDAFGGEQEVDACHVMGIAADDVLCRWSGQPRLPYEREESALQDCLATAVDQQPIEKSHATLPATTELGESFGEHQRCRQAQTSAVNRCGEATLRRLRARQIEHGSRRRCAPEAGDSHHVDRPNRSRRVNGCASDRRPAARSSDGELDRLARPVEAVQRRRRLVADEGVLTEREQPDLQSAVPRVCRASDHDDARQDRDGNSFWSRTATRTRAVVATRTAERGLVRRCGRCRARDRRHRRSGRRGAGARCR